LGFQHKTYLADILIHEELLIVSLNVAEDTSIHKLNNALLDYFGRKDHLHAYEIKQPRSEKKIILDMVNDPIEYTKGFLRKGFDLSANPAEDSKKIPEHPFLMFRINYV